MFLLSERRQTGLSHFSGTVKAYNNTYKAVQRSANAVAIGPVLQGLNKPVNDLSRGCTVTDIVNTVVITAIQAQAETPKGTLETAKSEALA